MQRDIQKIKFGNPTQDGAGVNLIRVISHSDVKLFDPFLMLDAFDSKNPSDYVKGFPWHPHRGIETITYLIHGKIEHGDSLGNKGQITDGECQWMTAGSGILHQEMPKESEHMLGVQLWLNLPKKDKMTTPKYRDLNAKAIPKIKNDAATIHIISGDYANTKGAINGDSVQMTFMDIELEPNATFSYMSDPNDTLFIYTLNGSGWFYSDKKQSVPEKCAVLFNPGDEMIAYASKQGMRFLLFSGKPLNEPIAWGGPIVMNTNEELQQAFRDLEQGTFIKNTPIY